MSQPASTVVHRFPDNVVREIIMNCAENESRVVLPFSQSTDLFRHSVALVCKQWAEILYRTPRVWSSIFLAAQSADTPSDITCVALDQLSLCLSRSQGHTLTITFDRRTRSPWTIDSVHRVSKLCGQFVESMSLPILSQQDTRTFLSAISLHFPVLKHIDIFTHTINSSRHVSSLPNFLNNTVFNNAPHLTAVEVHYLNGVHPIDLRLTWANIQHLDLGGTAIPCDVFMRIMRLTSLSLQNGFFYVRMLEMERFLAPPRRPADIILMEQMSHLRLRLLYPSLDERALTFIRYPNLVDLHVETYDVGQEWDLARYTTLLRACSTSLKRLRLTDFVPSPELTLSIQHRPTSHRMLDNLLKATPNLNYLSLPLSVQMHAVTLEKLSSSTLLPGLLDLELAHPDAFRALSMVRRRAESAAAGVIGVGSSTAAAACHPAPDTLLLWLPDNGTYNLEDLDDVHQERRKLIEDGITCRVTMQLADFQAGPSYRRH